MPSDQHDPPSGDGRAPADSLQEALRALSLRATADALELVQRLKGLRDQFDGTALAGGDSSGVSAEPRRQPGEVVYEAVRLNLQIANEIMTFGQRQADFWLDRLQRTGVAMLPREQRPAVRVACAARDDDRPLAWTLYVFNAAHEPRSVRLVGRWRAPLDVPCELTFEGGERSVVVPPRTQRELVVEHARHGDLAKPGEHVADAEVFMQSEGVSAMPGAVVGKLELAAVVKGSAP